MRTFIAIDLPLSVQQTLTTTQRTLKQRMEGAGVGRAVRWTSIEKVHLTLRFLGETSDVQRPALDRELAEIGATEADFELALHGLGCFPNVRRPSVLWVGISGDLAALDALQSRIEAAARRAGFDPEKRVYSPHLTIARVQRNANSQSRRDIGQTLQRFDRPVPTTSFNVDHITHIRSVLRADGAVYTPLSQVWFQSRMMRIIGE